ALLLDAGLVAAGAYLDLGNTDAAGAILKGLPLKALQESAPLGQLQTLAALALMARLEGDLSAAEAHLLDRLELARTHYPMPLYLADIHLALADSYQAAGQHDALLAHARQARTLAEETGDIDTLMESYRYLAASYFRNGDTDAAVQLALAAAPIIDQARDVASKAYFLQFSAMSLNLRGHFSPARDYTTALRALGETSADPMYGAIADFTVMHRLYVQGAFTEAYRLASSTRSRLESSAGLHAAVPAALAFEAIAASRGASLDTAGSLIRLLETRYPDDMSLPAPILRARGHVALRNKQFTRGLQFLREAEAAYRQAGMRAVGNYVGYEIIESRLAGEAEPPWDDIQRLSALTDFDYPLARLQAQAHAKESNYLGATAALEEARLRGNDLWSDRDQLILEEYRSVLAMADVPNSLGSGPDGT
ncbi:MAG: hypothetical protein RJQ10_12575, partial [Haliea sp.]|uniref:hypothetical protein n=1 Tax=Haliea sp. TaxID=1932666 RepID=UPI0032ED7C7C